MNTVALLLAVVVGCVADEVSLLGQPSVVRVPDQDSAIIQSHRLGGNFAYSTHEAHAYGVQTPIIKQRVVPKGVTYHQGQPIVKTYTSFVKQEVPQYGVVRTQHSVPAVQYATGQQVVTSRVSTPVQYVAGAAPVQYLSGTGPVKYTAGTAPVQYLSGTGPVQYTAGTAPVQYLSGTGPVQYTAGTAPVQYLSGTGPVKYTAGTAPVPYGTGAFPMQYAAGVTPVQYVSGTGPVQYVASGAAPVQVGAPVQLAVTPAQYITDKAKAVEVEDA